MPRPKGARPGPLDALVEKVLATAGDGSAPPRQRCGGGLAVTSAPALRLNRGTAPDAARRAAGRRCERRCVTAGYSGGQVTGVSRGTEEV